MKINIIAGFCLILLVAIGESAVLEDIADLEVSEQRWIGRRPSYSGGSTKGGKRGRRSVEEEAMDLEVSEIRWLGRRQPSSKGNRGNLKVGKGGKHGRRSYDRSAFQELAASDQRYEYHDQHKGYGVNYGVGGLLGR